GGRGVRAPAADLRHVASCHVGLPLHRRFLFVFFSAFLLVFSFMACFQIANAGGTIEMYDSLGMPIIHESDSNFHAVYFPEETLEDGLHYDKEEAALIFVAGDTQKTIPLWLSIFPPLIAIFLALAFREVHIALFVGIWFGAFVVEGLSGGAFISSIFRIVDTYFIDALTDGGHASIIVFSLLIGAMVAIISKNGGMQGIVYHVSKLATSARRSQMATWLMGMIIFFDDYANTLVVGNTMRPLTDKYKISREKLAYIVDSTAAPIAAIAFVTTWIGYQLGEIKNGMEAQGFIANEMSEYALFLGSLKYAYYPILTILFVFLIIVFKRDFGPMKKAEDKARVAERKIDSAIENNTVKKWAWLNAALPVLTLVVMVMTGIWITGVGYTDEADLVGLGFFSKLQLIVGNADSYVALLWASLVACIVAVFMSVLSRAQSVKESIESLIEGVKSMLPAIIILILAWSLAAVVEDLHTADFLTSLLPASGTALWLPFIIFILSALISFSTGSSWSTMAIMYPICIPVVLGLATAQGTIDNPAEYMPVLFNTISVILAASVMGDHCSPISDTTILSSLASDCDHISHVRTQLPYALAVGIISLLCGGVLFAVGLPWWLCYIIGIALVFAVVLGLGKKEV
ncbi:MAG: Na+/H+ antiporter NhaC family protein, partial [Chitinophagales bacterium]